jgi:osmotically-inducible protein OsmY
MTLKNTRTWTGALSAAGLMLALAAPPAAAQSSTATSSAKQQDKADNRDAGDRINDAWILTKVKSQFTGEDALEHSDINVDVRNHVVILKGTVPTAAGKARAAEIARKTEGVSRVDNRLVVGMSADAVKDANENAREAKQDARENAREAREDAKENAREAKQDAKESAREAREDAKDSAREAREDARESARDAKHDAKQSAENAKDKADETTREAKQDAKESARDAKGAGAAAVGTTGAAVTDGWITTKVKSSFVGVDALDGSDIDVDTNNHIVTLRGTVPSENAKNRAVAIAKKVDGVTSVKSELKIAPKQ